MNYLVGGGGGGDFPKAKERKCTLKQHTVTLQVNFISVTNKTVQGKRLWKQGLFIAK